MIEYIDNGIFLFTELLNMYVICASLHISLNSFNSKRNEQWLNDEVIVSSRGGRHRVANTT